MRRRSGCKPSTVSPSWRSRWRRTAGPRRPADLWLGLRKGNLPADWQARMGRVLSDLGGVAQSVWRKRVLGTYVNKPVREILVRVTLDPLPNRDSRVTLTDRRDALGVPLAALDWRLSPEDERSMAPADAGPRRGAGAARARPRAAPSGPGGTRESGWARAGQLRGHGVASGPRICRSAGITWARRAWPTDPREGVVDGQCRVHGIDNLFVAGSSIFPTTGNANPTLTIVAMALRLSDHLQARLAA